MKQILLALVAFFALQILPAQDVTYVLFNRACMNQLEYRYSYPNLKGENAVWAYSMKPNEQEHFIFLTEGDGHYSPELPKSAVSCRNLDLDDAFAANINRGALQMLIVFQRQSGGYWLMPVESATLVARKGAKYWVRTKQSSFQFDTLRLVNEQNLAVTGSPTAAYFSGAKINNCLMEYSFHCEPVKTGQIRSDLQFIPDIGIVNDRTGNSASQAMENELQLVKVNGKALDDYITEACPEGSGKITMSKYQKPAAYGDGAFETDKEISSIMQKEQEGELSPRAYFTDADGNSCMEEWETGTHIVQKGENLRAIARTYKVTEQQLIKWNKIQNPDRIEICQKIWLKQPPASSRSTANKGVKPQVYDVQPETGKTVKIQGATQGQKGIQNVQAQRKSLDPNRPVEHSSGTADSNDYEYFKSEKTIKDGRPRIHTVRRGEYLYKIAKMYACPEECIRLANAMPLEGDEPLSIGQEIIIPECSCTLDGETFKKPTGPSKTPTVKNQTKLTEKQPYTSPKKPRASILDDTESPAEYGFEDGSPDPERVEKTNRYEEKSLYEDESTRTSGNKPAGTKSKKGETNNVPLFKEHHVKQGETLNSIAAKFRVDASELSQVNGLSPKEALTPGKLILIPIEEQ
ncbi:MAG: LysM peptidoglycan-binding domain-containing protein [Saprospiraceae bacterium]